MLLRHLPVRAWMVAPGVLFALAVQAQSTVLPAVPVSCGALTVLAADPPKAQELTEVVAAVVAASASAAASAPTAVAVGPAAIAAAQQAITAAAQASYRIPVPVLQPNTVAEWGSRIELAFQPPIRGAVAKCLEAELGLFLDHLPLGITPIERVRAESGVVTIAYRIQRPPAAGAGWIELLSKLWKSEGSTLVTVGVGVGSTELGVATDRLSLKLGPGGPWLAWLALVGSALLLALVWWQSKILQDRRDGPMSYSLSRLLLGCWVLTTVCVVSVTVLRTGAMPDTTEAGLALLLAVSGATTGLSGLIDLIREPTNFRETRFWEDFLDDADGLALHRVQVVIFNLLVLVLVWRELVQLGTVARIDSKWSVYLGASALIFVFGKWSEKNTPSSRSS